MATRIRTLLIILLLTLVPSFLLWLPFILKIPSFWGIPLHANGMATIVANYDGPIYLVIAKTFYNKGLIASQFSFPLPLEYYPAHFPLFPAIIRLFSSVLGYPYAMLTVTLASGSLALYFFYKLARENLSETNALWLTLVFSILPARWLIVRSVGTPEPLFLASIIASVYYFNKKNFLAAGVWGALAGFTKPPGILLFPAYVLALALPTFKNVVHASFDKVLKELAILKTLPLFLIPLSLIGVFYIFKFTYGDFFAYFKSGDNIHLFFPPFQVFNYSQPWVGTYWLEEIIFVYLIGIVGIFKLIEKRMTSLAWVAGVFLFSVLFVSHRDIVRYALPAVPFVLLGYSDTIVRKEFKYVLLVLLIPIYLFSLAFVSQNVMPISDWAPFL